MVINSSATVSNEVLQRGRLAILTRLPTVLSGINTHYGWDNESNALRMPSRVSVGVPRELKITDAPIGSQVFVNFSDITLRDRDLIGHEDYNITIRIDVTMHVNSIAPLENTYRQVETLSRACSDVLIDGLPGTCESKQGHSTGCYNLRYYRDDRVEEGKHGNFWMVSKTVYIQGLMRVHQSVTGGVYPQMPMDVGRRSNQEGSVVLVDSEGNIISINPSEVVVIPHEEYAITAPIDWEVWTVYQRQVYTDGEITAPGIWTVYAADPEGTPRVYTVEMKNP